MLARDICGDHRITREPGHRCSVDNGPASTRPKRGYDRFHAQKNAGDVHGHDLLKDFEWVLVEWTNSTLYARVVEESVHPAKMLHRLVHVILDIRGARDIGLDHDRFAPGSLGRVQRPVQRCSREIHRGYPRTFPCKTLYRRQADPPRGARYDHHLILEALRHIESSLPCPRVEPRP